MGYRWTDSLELALDLIEELKRRDIIRTKNIVGELGEYYAVKIFNETANLPKLQLAPEAIIAAASYFKASGCLNPPNSPQSV